jgi:hypothetical protein
VTLNQFANRTIHAEIMRRCMTRPQIDRCTRIAAWLVWSMRRTSTAQQHKEQFNRARRVMQRAGKSRV